MEGTNHIMLTTETASTHSRAVNVTCRWMDGVVVGRGGGGGNGGGGVRPTVGQSLGLDRRPNGRKKLQLLLKLLLS